MTLNVSHVILGSSGVNSIASLPRMIYWTPLRYSSCSTSAEHRQLQASHTSTFAKTSGKAPHSQSTSSPWDCPCDNWHQARPRGSGTADKHPTQLHHQGWCSYLHTCVLQDKRNGKRKTVQSTGVSVYLLFPPHHCCSYTLLSIEIYIHIHIYIKRNKLFFAFFFNFKIF